MFPLWIRLWRHWLRRNYCWKFGQFSKNFPNSKTSDATGSFYLTGWTTIVFCVCRKGMFSSPSAVINFSSVLEPLMNILTQERVTWLPAIRIVQERCKNCWGRMKRKDEMKVFIVSYGNEVRSWIWWNCYIDLNCWWKRKAQKTLKCYKVIQFRQNTTQSSGSSVGLLIVMLAATTSVDFNSRSPMKSFQHQTFRITEISRSVQKNISKNLHRQIC